MPKVLIYNADGVGPKSAADMKSFFEEVLGNQDVSLSDFTGNFSGQAKVDKPILVIPGGSAFEMQAPLVSAYTSITQSYPNTFHTLAICAGAYWVGAVDFCQTCYEYGSNGYTTLPEVVLTRGVQSTLNILPGAYALGPFQPNVSIALDQTMDHLPAEPPIDDYKLHPCAISLKPSRGPTFNTLFIDGCGFKTPVQTNDADECKGKPEREIALQAEAGFGARSFFFKTKAKSQEQYPLSAVISGPTKGQSDCRTVATGTHVFEAAVSDSQLLALATNPELKLKSMLPLSERAVNAIKDSQANAQEFCRDLVKRNFGC